MTVLHRHRNRTKPGKMLASMVMPSRARSTHGGAARQKEGNHEASPGPTLAEKAPEEIRKCERVQLAYHLHDGPARRLVECLHRLEICERTMGPDQAPVLAEMHAVAAAVRRSLDEMRGIIYQYRNGHESPDLARGLADIVKEFRNLSSIEVSLDAPADVIKLASEQVTALYAVVEEALFNAWRHGLPSGILVKLEQRAGEVEVTVTDDGPGFHLAEYWKSHANGERPNSVGLMGLRERVEKCGGDFKLQSQPGAGTVVGARFRPDKHAA